MAYEAKGKITAIGETIQASEKFRKRSFDLTETGVSYNGDEWKNLLVMEFTNDKCALLDAVSIGDEVTAKFVVSTNRGKSQAGKDYCITNIRAVSIEVTGKAQQPTTTPTPVAQTTQPLSAPTTSAPIADDDIPF